MLLTVRRVQSEPAAPGGRPFNNAVHTPARKGRDAPTLTRRAEAYPLVDGRWKAKQAPNRRPPFEAPKLMVEQMKGQFDRAILRKLVKFLGPRNGFVDLAADFPDGEASQRETMTEAEQQEGNRGTSSA